MITHVKKSVSLLPFMSFRTICDTSSSHSHMHTHICYTHICVHTFTTLVYYFCVFFGVLFIATFYFAFKQFFFVAQFICGVFHQTQKFLPWNVNILIYEIFEFRQDIIICYTDAYMYVCRGVRVSKKGQWNLRMNTWFAYQMLLKWVTF